MQAQFDVASMSGLRISSEIGLPNRRKLHQGGTSISNPLNMRLTRRPATAGSSRVAAPAPKLTRPVSATVLEKKEETLTFAAYFVEPVLEYTSKSVPYQARRVRKCLISFFPLNATVAVDEPKTKNSGYVQGRLLKRCHARKTDGSAFCREDFAVGRELEIFGRVFVIVDADTRTRRSYDEEYGVDLGPAIEYPDDGFDAERARMEISRPLRPDTARPLSAPASKKADEPVLRFFCAYQEDRPGGDHRHYTLHYFLADETIEIKEVPTEGVQRFPNLLRRSRLPRRDTTTPLNPLTEPARPTQFVAWEDLRCGSTIWVWGRPLLLLSCDRRTEAWYMTRGITQQPLQVAGDEGEAFPQTLPPFNGFGAENDLYAMGLSLQPAVVNSTQDDYQRFMAADNKVLRFECSLLGDSPRAFVINYYLGDDTIMVYEPPVRNSGFTGGVFLTRSRYKKHIPDQRSMEKHGMGSVLSRWLRPADFYEGAQVALEAPATGRLLHTFKVVKADDYTKRVEKEQQLTAGSRMAIVMEQLAERLCAARVQVRSTFKALDSRKTRFLKAYEFKKALRAMDNEALTSGNCGSMSSLDDAMLDDLARQFGADYDQVRYDEFVDNLVLAAPMPTIPELKSSSTTNVSHKSLELALVAPLRRQLRRESGLLRASFHAEDPRNTGTVDADAWYRVLRKHKLHGVLSRNEADQLKQRYSEPSELHAGVEYERLCDKAFEGDFQNYMAALLMLVPERGDLSSVDLTAYRKHLEGGHKIPTVRTYLDRVNASARDCGGDTQSQLKHSMQAFASAFGRNHRQKMLRKHLMAFDVKNTGSCNKREFDDSLKRIIADGYCDLDTRELALLLAYIFPHSWTRQPYDILLAKLIARDVKGIVRMHDAALHQQEDPRFLFR